jgi:hypothetical protein
MALTKRQLSVAEAIKGKTLGLMLLKKQDAKTDLLVRKTLNEISGLIETYELEGEKDLMDAVVNALIRLKIFGAASSFKRKHKKR